MKILNPVDARRGLNLRNAKDMKVPLINPMFFARGIRKGLFLHSSFFGDKDFFFPEKCTLYLIGIVSPI